MSFRPLKFLALAAFALVLAHPVPAASRPVGFEDIPFGTPRADVLDGVCRRLKIEKVQGFAGVDYRGPDGLRLLDEEDDIVVRGYRLDRTRVDAVLLFNANGKFARVQYEAQRRPAGYFQTTIKDDAVALSKSFQKRFGAPTFQMEPRLSEMRPGSRNFFWRWTRGRETVFTAIVADEDDFGAVGVIGDDALMREAPLHRPEPAPPAEAASPEAAPRDSVPAPAESAGTTPATVPASSDTVVAPAPAALPAPVESPSQDPAFVPPADTPAAVVPAAN